MNYTFQFEFTTADWATLFAGAVRTLWYSSLGMVVGLAIGIVGAIWRNSRLQVLRLVAGGYVEFVRNTPLLIQLFLIFFGLPMLGVRLSADQAAIVALTFNFGAYATEIVRAGIAAVPSGQIEAGHAMGLTWFETFRHIVILPGIERVYPALISQFTLLMLGSSIVSAIGANELTSAANSIQSRNFRSFEVYTIATLAYLGLTLLFRLGFHWLGYVIFPRRRIIGVAATKVR
ncbi:amino acid ABC transporter permease [Alsobacter sp. SYSU BS001988]